MTAGGVLSRCKIPQSFSLATPQPKRRCACESPALFRDRVYGLGDFRVLLSRHRLDSIRAPARIRRYATRTFGALMTGISRRKLITTGLATAAGACGLGVAARLADRYGLIPPDHGGIYGAGETLTYAAQRLLMSRHSLAREFSRSEISKAFPVNGEIPESETYERLAAGGFVDWRLMVDGLIARPIGFSLAELKRLPSRTQITHQACEEGWSFIAEWTGVALSDVLHSAGVRREAKYVV